MNKSDLKNGKIVTIYEIKKEIKEYCKLNRSPSCKGKCGLCATSFITSNYNVTRKDNK